MRTSTRLAVVIIVLGALRLCCGCGTKDQPLPGHFLLGVATAGFQNDPGCPTIGPDECTDSHSDWYDFVTKPDLVMDPGDFVTGEPLDHAPGSYELFATDFDLVKNSLHGNAMRLSIEWSRLFPRTTVGTDGYDALRALADPRALDHYHQVFAALKARGLTPLVTLHHYTLPSWIHDAEGCHKDLARCALPGWLNQDGTVKEIAKYAGFCAREYGGEVDLWATLNEPFAVVVPAYVMSTKDRSNPPAVALATDPVAMRPAARSATLAMINAHARMYDAIKQNDTVDAGSGQAARVGLVYNMTPAAPADPTNPLDVQAAQDFFYIYDQVFLNAVIKGDLDMQMDGTITHRDDLAGRMDYLGINYYTRVVVEGAAKPFLPQISPRTRFNPFTLSIWNEYPQGISDMVQIANGTYNVPAIITENGTSSQDDATAQRLLVQHLGWLQRAAAGGARVEGYFYWTLVDNYEWNHGMSEHFGLYQLQQDSHKTRTPRPVAGTYADIIQAHAVPGRLLDQYPLQ